MVILVLVQVTLYDLVASAQSTMSEYYAEGSRKNVLSHLRQLSVFCVTFNVTFIPTSRDTLFGFIDLLSRSCGYDHIKHIIASVRFLHQYKGLEFVGDTFEFSILYRSLQRKLAKPPKQALPITPEMMILMYQFVNINIPRQLAHWTSFIFALKLLYRKSSIAPTSLAKFDSRTGFSREKAVLSNNVVLVYQNFSKTNQFMATSRVTLLLPSKVPALDPVVHYAKLITENVVPKEYPVFSFTENNDIKCVTYSSFTRFLKMLLRKIGLDPDKWSGHSFQVVFAC